MPPSAASRVWSRSERRATLSSVDRLGEDRHGSLSPQLVRPGRASWGPSVPGCFIRGGFGELWVRSWVMGGAGLEEGVG